MSTRRAFMQSLAVPFLAKPLLSEFSPSTSPEGSILRIAQMGLGSYAERVGNALKESKRAQITGLISGTPEKLRTYGAK